MEKTPPSNFRPSPKQAPAESYNHSVRCNQRAMSDRASIDAAPAPSTAMETPLLRSLSAGPFYSVAVEHHGARSMASCSTTAQELAALLTTAGVYDLGWRTHLRCTGKDRVRWLNGMVTNHVGALAPNAGCYAFVLNAQGRIQGDMDIYQRGDALWLETDLAQAAALTAFLERFIIMDDVALEASSAWTPLGIAGPGAPAVLRQLGLETEGLTPLALRECAWDKTPVLLMAVYGPLVPRFELWTTPEQIVPLWDALQTAGANACGTMAWEQLRVLEGAPAYGTDITQDHLPQETCQDRALHFAKGCYLGQEVVERIRSRGHVHRVFTGFVLEAGAGIPLADTHLMAEGQIVGELTSVARITLPNGKEKTFALGHARREALDKKSVLSAGGETVVPAPLPFDWKGIDGPQR
jgi:aminomethyltransferase